MHPITPTVHPITLTAHSTTIPIPPKETVVLEKQYNENFTFKYPFTMMVAGPIACGKTIWIKRLLENAKTMIQPPQQRIVWFHKRGQPMYTEL